MTIDDYELNKEKIILKKVSHLVSDTITDLVDNYKAKKVEVNMMNTLDSNERNNSDDYLSIMNEYLRNLREATTNE